MPPVLPPVLRAALPEDHLSDDSESDTEDASARMHPTMATASSLFSAAAAAAAPSGDGSGITKAGRDAVPRVTTETARDRARLALARKERATGIDDARWLDRRLTEIDAAIVDPTLAFEFQCI
jgi:hypothetical protein